MVKKVSYCGFWETDIGWLKISGDNSAITELSFCEATPNFSQQNENFWITESLRQLEAYFSGTLERFELPLRPHGTHFQRKVWQILQTIPYGKTTTYGEIAQMLGDENLVRAVGQAVGANPIAIIIPCHRVIGKGEALIGYSGGLWRKEWLLRHEGYLLV
jgi:methylated-DNA-[protein]-cysteine S-methyltransferase